MTAQNQSCRISVLFSQTLKSSMRRLLEQISSDGNCVFELSNHSSTTFLLPAQR
jgi:hypothetical protein